MKISYNWLKTYFPEKQLPSPGEISGYLTDCGLEVEGMNAWQSVKGGLKGVVIGEVKTCEKHPNSDHLSITTVDVGRPELLHIVCGASNVAAGQKVPVATLGTTLFFGDKELTLQKTKIRGEVSEGMICAEDELGLGNSHAGIMVLDPAAKPGTPAAEYFGIEEDIVLEIGLTPNRSDATSHTGVARDLAAVLHRLAPDQESSFQYQRPDVSAFTVENNSRNTEIHIEDLQACPRYAGLTMTGITVKESPEWLKNRLNAIGLRPINNIVDVTNFILHELGQPLHAFDADKISGGKVVIKKLASGTKFITLDGVERTLTDQDLMICDGEKPMVIAGVFGGLASGVTLETKNIFIESATFDPRTIRKTSRYHGLQTDASFRFERGTDIDINIYALQRAALLIKEVAGGTVSSGITDVYPHPKKESEVTLTRKNLTRLVGQEIDPVIVGKILKSLFITIVEENQDMWKLKIPNFKVDVTREVDVIEEILRIYGYNHIQFSDNIRSPLNIAAKPDPEKVQNLVSELLVSNGFNEIMNNSLTKSSYYENNEAFPAENCVKILNPLSRDLDVMRQTLLYGGLETLEYNQNRKAADQKLFEFGNVYRKLTMPVGQKPLDAYPEEKHLAIFLTGKKFPENWNNPDAKVDFYFLKAYVQNILTRLGLTVTDLQEWNSPLVSRGLQIMAFQKPLVTFGVLSSALLRRFDLKQDVYFADFSWDLLLNSLKKGALEATELPKFPEVRRDLALELDKNVTFAEIRQTALATEKNLLKEVGLFDFYEGDKIGQNKKSYAIYCILADERKTLNDNEIDKTMKKLIRAFEEKLGAKLRGS
ncbi:MAG: phenylalanine--tRNA ligase subunit beta [Syntrophothermus sp.]